MEKNKMDNEDKRKFLEEIRKKQNESIKKTISRHRISFLDKDLKEEFKEIIKILKVVELSVFFGDKTKKNFELFKSLQQAKFNIIQEAMLRRQMRFNKLLLVFTIGMFLIMIFEIIRFCLN